MKPTIAMVAGDACGIGPELLAKLLQEEQTKQSNNIIISDKRLIEQGMDFAKCRFDYKETDSLDNLDFSQHQTLLFDTKKIDPQSVTLAKESAEAGKAVMEELTLAVDLVQAKKAQSVLFTPINKLAMNMGGL